MSTDIKVSQVTYTQGMHSCGDPMEEAILCISREDAGGGDYLVISAKEWAIDDLKDLEMIFDKIREFAKEIGLE